VNPTPFRHWVWSKVPAHSPKTLTRFVEDATGVSPLAVDWRTSALEAGQHMPLNTGSNWEPELGWRCFEMVIFTLSGTWDSMWGGQMELWGEHDDFPAVSFAPAPGRAILLEYGDHNWWGFPIPVRGPYPLYLLRVDFYSSAPPENASAPHRGFPHPKGIAA
jgi:hypothetical protein